MGSLFSERYGYKQVKKLRLGEMSETLRTRLWNSLSNFFITLVERSIDGREIIIKIWDKFFKEDIDEIRYESGTAQIYYIKGKFSNLKWYEVFDLIEFLIREKEIIKIMYSNTFFINAHENLIKEVNKIFEEERAPYKIIGNCIAPLVSESEAEEIEKALKIDDKYSEVRIHISKALEFYSKRPPDFQNSIKESISAVEALARIILNNPNATLGHLIKKLPIHPAFQEALTKLYGWTSDESGIRHSYKPDTLPLQVSGDEARFILVICSAFVNYIISKESEIL